MLILCCVVLFGSLYSVRAVLTMALKEARWSVFTFEDKSANPIRCERTCFDRQIDARAEFIDRFGYPPRALGYIAISATAMTHV